MNRKKLINEYKISDVLHRYVPLVGLLQYKVTSIRTFEKGDNQLITQCLSCRHGFKCEVLVVSDATKNLIASEVLNTDDDDFTCFHINDKYELPFRSSEKRAYLDIVKSNQKYYNEEIKNAKSSLQKAKDQLASYEKKLEEYNIIFAETKKIIGEEP